MIQLNETPHYFIAINLSDDLKNKLFSNQMMIKQQIGEETYEKWTNQTDFHITLAFLGALTDKDLITAKNCLNKVKDTKSFHVQLATLAGFGQRQSPRVLMHQVTLNEELVTLQQQLKKVLQAAQFNVEKRSFNPHVTYAKKCKYGYQLECLSWKIKEDQIPFIDQIVETVTDISLFRIYPGDTPQYKAVMTIFLK